MQKRTADERLELFASIAVLAAAGALVIGLGWSNLAGDESPGPGGANLPADDTPLPWMTGIRRGQLDNGLSYLVLSHKKPEQRAQLWLQVAAGAVHETDDQRGLAHFVEHMAFNGTARYDKQAIIDYLEGVGMRFGPEINAGTGFDRTVYKLKIPTDDPDTVSKGLDFLHQWATAVSFEEQAVIDERGVVLEEWRQNQGSDMRGIEDLLPVLFAGSRYAERLPIGTPESIQTATRDRLLAYYRDWYRPDLMTVVAVGDFDAAAMETQIRAVFADVQPAQGAPERSPVPVPDLDELGVVVTEDEALSDTTVMLFDILPRQSSQTFGDDRRQLAAITGVLALNFRYQELIQAESDPALKEAAVAPVDELVEPVTPIIYTGTVAEGRLSEAVEILFTERRRAIAHGFTEAEVDKVRPMLKAILGMEAAREPDKDSEELVSDLADSALYGSPQTSAAELHKVYEQMIEELTADAVTSTFADEYAGKSLALQVKLPVGKDPPSPAAIREIFATVEAAELSPWDRGGERVPLMADRPQPGSITEETTGPYDVIEWRLSNGARVLVKPTDFQQGQILFRAASPGGRSLVEDADLDSATTAAQVFAQVGLGELDRIQLRDATMGAIAGVTPWLAEGAEQIDGATRPEDLELQLQLIHLTMLDLRDDATAFERWQRQNAEEWENAAKVPRTVFGQQALFDRFDRHPRYAPMTAGRVRALSLGRIRELYRQRFGNAGDFSFVFVGDVDPAALRPLVETYLASLPTTDASETPAGRDIGYARGEHRWVGEVNPEPKSEIALRYHVDGPWSRDLEIDHELVAEVMRIRLRERMREDESGTYGVGVQAMHHDPMEFSSLSVSFTCDPTRADALLATLDAELETLRNQGPTDEELAKVREIWASDHEEAVKDNGYWRRVIARAYRRGEPVELHHELAPRLARVSADVFRAALERFLASGNRQLTMTMPAEPEPAAPAGAAPGPGAEP